MHDNDRSAARAVVEACVAIGVREFVVCAGARNAEVIAVLAASSGIRCYQHPEERSAAFFALGRVMRTGAPVAVLTTSGTAAAELLPATIEAFYQALPLVLVTADRPERFRGSGAPQAIEQVGLYGGYACAEIDAWPGNLPLHINVPLEEPTSEAIASATGIDLEAVQPMAIAGGGGGGEAALGRFLQGGGDLLVMVGCLPEPWRAGVADFLERLGAVVYLEAGSGLRERLAGLPRAGRGDRVLRIGGVPSCRFWRDLESNADIPVFSIAPNGLPGLARESEVVSGVDWGAVEIVQRVATEGGSVGVCEFLERYPRSEASWFRHLSEVVPAGALVFLGNSLPLREWNLAATYRDRGLRCFASRGANGIDGCVSTFLGMACDEEEAWLICGDLTAIYDLAGPWMLGQLGARNLRLVVINNSGGRIFDRLPALGSASDDARAMIRNSHAVRFDSWAEMWGMGYRRVEESGDLDDLPAGAMVIEVLPDSAESAAFWEDWGRR
jgi:2-succinyl-5-enolpyruvyl-6-hydroxy-3-cyclohexene-1-carboxylate synthase